MKVSNSKIVRRLPAELIGGKSDQDDAYELLENMHPQVINTAAALIERMVTDLGLFNTWSDPSIYEKEFRLDEIFPPQIADVMSIDQVELLKGFFQFKGTRTDLEYILNSAGFQIEILDSDYYSRNSIHEIIYDFGFTDLFFLIDDYNTEYLEELASTTTKLLVNNLDPIIVNNVRPTVLGGLESYGAEMFRSLGITDYTSSTENDLTQVMMRYYSFRAIDTSVIDCSITVKSILNLDSNSSADPSVANRLIRAIVGSRMLPCITLVAVVSYLISQDVYNPRTRIEDWTSNYRARIDHVDTVNNDSSEITGLNIITDHSDVFDNTCTETLDGLITRRTIIKVNPLMLRVGDKVISDKDDVKYIIHVGSPSIMVGSFTI